MSNPMLQLQAAAAGGDIDAQYRLGLTLARQGDAGRAAVWYQRAAHAGHVGALRELGLFLMFGIGLPVRIDAARNALRQAADAGDADACYWLARHAFTDGDDAAIEAAMRLLEQAANAGQALAARTLGLMLADAGYPAAAHEHLVRARQAGDAHSESLLASPHFRQESSSATSRSHEIPSKLPVLAAAAPAITALNADPYIAICDDAFSPMDCVHAIELARGYLRPSETVDSRTGRIIRNDYRSSSSSQLQSFQEDPWIVWLQRRLCALFDAPLSRAEPLSVLHYAPGQQYLPHQDYLPPNALVSDEGRRSGQRVQTVFVYLNDVESGGETDFPDLGVRIAPKRGRAVLFRNLLPDGQPDVRTRHAGLPVETGEKWLATLWIRERPIRPDAGA